MSTIDVVHLARAGGLQRVEEHGAGIAARALADHVGLGALAPDFQLLDGGGAEGVGGAQQHGALSFLKRLASLPMVVVLPEPLTPTTSTTAGGSATRARARSLAGRISSRCSRIRPLQLGGVVQLVALHALPDAVQNLLGGPHADIGGDQRVLQFVEQVGVDLLLALQRVFQRGDQPRAGLLHAAFQLFKEGGLLFDGAE